MGTLPKSAFVAGLFLLGTTASSNAEWPPQYETPYDDYQGGQYDPHWVMDEAAQCWAYDAHAGSDDSITWSGECSDGKVSGQGTLTYFDHGRMFERVSGDFSEGFLQDGRVSILWNDGSRYDGEEQNGQFNGYGTLIASDGTRYEGLWKDDKFQGSRQAAEASPSSPANANPPIAPQPKPTARVLAVPKVSTDRRVVEKKPEKAFPLSWAQFGKVLGKPLVAADGSKLLLERTDNGCLRETIEHPEGASLSVTFVPLGEHIGTVQDNGGKVIATFHLSRSLSAAFADGRVETIAAVGAETVRTSVHGASTAAETTAWYPQGHAFQRAGNDPAPRESQKPARVANDPPPVDATRLAAVRSIEIRAGAPVSVRRAHRNAIRPLLSPGEKPAAFAFAPRSISRPDRSLMATRLRADDQHERVAMRPHALVAQTIQPQTELSGLRPGVSTTIQHRIALALRRHKREQVAAATAPASSEYKPASSAQNAPVAAQVVSRDSQRAASSNSADPGPRHVSAQAAPRPIAMAKPSAPPIVSAAPVRTAEATIRHPAVSPDPPTPAPKQLPGVAAPMTKAAKPPVAVALARGEQPKRPDPNSAAPTSPTPMQRSQLSSSKPQMAPPPQRVVAASRPNAAPPRIAPVVTQTPSAPKAVAAVALQQTPQLQVPVEKVASLVAPMRPAIIPRQATEPPEKIQSATAPQAPSVQSPPVASGTDTDRPAALPKREEKRDVVAALAPPAAVLPAPEAQLSSASAIPPPLHTIGGGAPPRRSASDCLTVESDGTHWGFRNHCPADIQFSYCLLNSTDRLTSCSVGAASGSVAGNGFSALVADTSIKDPRANRAFRWVGCVGGAGEVSPRLDRIDPPMGRCLHSGQVPEGLERADVAIHRQ